MLSIYRILVLYPFLSAWPIRINMEAENALIIEVSADSDFTIQNIPFGVFHKAGEEPTAARCATRIGDWVIDLAALEADGHIKATDTPVFNKPTLNDFMDLSRTHWKAVRHTIQQLLKTGSAITEELQKGAASKYLIAAADAIMLLPANIGDYTDFYSSYNHAFNLGCMFRGADNALQPNWLSLPVAYHGRASSVVVSGTSITRPISQKKPPTADEPVFGPSNRMDYELEMGTFIGNKGNKLGRPIKISEAEDYIFGVCLMNDWSARDLQAWEYVPLGPFTAKNLGTVISPWIVTLEALEPFRVALPEPKKPFLDYLKDPNYSSYDINLEVYYRLNGTTEEHKLATSNYKYLYWSMAQQTTHHTVTGCNLRTGDLFGSGISFTKYIRNHLWTNRCRIWFSHRTHSEWKETYDSRWTRAHIP